MIYGEDQPAILPWSKQKSCLYAHVQAQLSSYMNVCFGCSPWVFHSCLCRYREWLALHILFSSPQSSSASESIQFTLSSHDRSCGGRMVALLQCQSDIQSCCFGYLHIRVVQVSKVKGHREHTHARGSHIYTPQCSHHFMHMCQLALLMVITPFSLCWCCFMVHSSQWHTSA